MKIQTHKPAKTSLLLTLLLAGVAPLQAQINSWTNPGPGKWEVGTNWALGTPPGTNDIYDNIFTGGPVTIDATTSGSFPNTMTVNYVAVEFETLDLDNAGTNVPLHILQNLDITVDGALVTITNSALQVDGVMTAGIVSGDTGGFELDSGWAQFGGITLGNSGYGDAGLLGGVLTVLGTMTVGASPGGSGSLEMDGGTVKVLGTTTWGASPGSGGTLEMFCGTFIQTNNPIVLGSQGFGEFIIYGDSVQALGFQLGNAAGSSGQLVVNGGTVLVSSNIVVGNNLVTNLCSITVSSNNYPGTCDYGTSGALIVTNAAGTAYIDLAQNGSLTLLGGGVLIVDNLILTNGGTFNNLAGTFELVPPLNIDNGGSVVLAGSTNNFDGGIVLGSTSGGTGSLTLQSNSVMNVNSNFTLVSSSLTATSTVTLNGGSLIMSNGLIQVGPAGNGLMTVAGGSHIVRQILLGSTNGLGSGGLHFTGGHLKILGNGTGSGQGLVSNWILWEGGDLDGSGTSLTIALNYDSDVNIPSTAFDVSGQLDSMYVGAGAGYTGAYTQSGPNSQIVVSNQMILGEADCVNGAIGLVTLNNGTLYVTNPMHTAILDVLNGTVVLNAGATLVVDNLIITNACGHFIKEAGGVIIQNNPPNLSPNLDADGNGVSNTNKVLAGLDLLDPTSVFQITSVGVNNNADVNLTWTTEGGHSYVVQTNGNLSSGSFNDLSGVINVSGSGAGTTSYVHSGAATNRAGFYRVRLGP